MNFVWTSVTVISLLCSVFFGFPDKVLLAGTKGATDAVSLMLSLAGTLCFWSGILKIAEKGGAADRIRQLLSPAINRLFPHTKQKNKISMNILANLFGTGNAATPAGISAMEGMDLENGKKTDPSREMCRFAVMNTASLQFFPTTVISILASLGAEKPLSIVPLIWVSSLLSLLAALAVQTVFFKGGDLK